ncbi:Rv0909 family putative TA system antitoxin [Pseudonocardia pini]|uniref:Rv0909 family putative TA system antitoxin n=1 Tax=Pseudonocardia pini TaxID=2758030 RepID=UPI0015F06D0B|nr:Rv0909 family putative TA system antitoxin [Pseudonocardia pini]
MDFDALKGQAEKLLDEHGDKIEDGAEKVGEIVKERFGHEEQVDAVVAKIKDFVPDQPAT